jgi:hypothetical protein
VGDLSNAKPFSEVPSPFRYNNILSLEPTELCCRDGDLERYNPDPVADLSDSSGSGFVPWKPQKDGKIRFICSKRIILENGLNADVWYVVLSQKRYLRLVSPHRKISYPTRDLAICFTVRYRY